MPTLYVENIPEELYEALRSRAKEHHRSMGAEVIELLERNVSTARALKARKKLLHRILRLRDEPSGQKGPFPSAEQMIREDRER